MVQTRTGEYCGLQMSKWERAREWLEFHKAEAIIVVTGLVAIGLVIAGGIRDSRSFEKWATDCEYRVDIDSFGVVYCDSYYIDNGGVLHLDGFYVAPEDSWRDEQLTARGFVICANPYAKPD